MDCSNSLASKFELQKMRSTKLFLLIFCSCLFTLFWIQFITKENLFVSMSLVIGFIKEAKLNIELKFKAMTVNSTMEKWSNEMKYILLWTKRYYIPFSYLEDGQLSFLKNNCSKINCFVTSNKYLFQNNLSRFHAIAFNAIDMKPHDLPSIRSPHQKYIFFSLESPVNYPVKDSVFDGFFNLTFTYRLDSDIPIPYILIKDKTGNVVGPNPVMHWKKMVARGKFNMINIIRRKTKAAAWFVSNCFTKNKRMKFIKTLKQMLNSYGHKIDMFGNCGEYKCPIYNKTHCNFMLKSDYYFYMSLENSFSADYVTEKLLTALNNEVVPVVYGGANYSRFVPPGSYIDARKLPPDMLSKYLNNLMKNPEEYNTYFDWKHHYTYHDPSRAENLCKICEALNDQKLMEQHTTCRMFRRWWNFGIPCS